MRLVNSGLINKNRAGKVRFLGGKVIIIEFSKDIYKKEIVILNLAISIRVITRNNRPGNTY